MPEGAVAEAPVIVPAAPIPKDPPKPTKQIAVTAETVDSGPRAAPPKPGSARADMFKALRKKVGAQSEEDEKPPAEPKKPVKKEAHQDIAKPEKPAEPPAPVVEEQEVPVEEAEQTEVEEKPAKKDEKKPNPWKLMETYKTKASQLEAELAELKAGKVPAEERDTFVADMKKLQERNKELEDEIRHVNYEKSSEFKTKYQEPYEKAWGVALAELGEIPVDDGQGGLRYATDQDLWELVNLSLGPARDRADEVFGKFADDVMAHRKEIRKLLEGRAMALKEAKTSGAERDKQKAVEMEMASKATATVIKETWEKFNKQALAHEKWGKYFAPAESDQEGNARLAKGYQMVDRAFNEDIRNPEMTSDQRQQAVQRLVAVRNRAAAFSRLVYMNEQLQAKYDELAKELEDYKSSSPDTAGSNTPPGQRPIIKGTAKDGVMDALRKIARPY